MEQPPSNERKKPQAVFATISVITSKTLGIPVAAVNMDDHFMDDLAADSLAMLTLRLAFERQFGVKVPMQSLGCLLTVQGAVDFFGRANPEDHGT